jgi:hypothetical protein
MTAKEILALVADMREAQREFFKTRDPEWLGKSKRLERKVDRVAGLPCCWVAADLCSACAIDPFMRSATSLYWLGLASRAIANQLDRGRQPQILRGQSCE